MQEMRIYLQKSVGSSTQQHVSSLYLSPPPAGQVLTVVIGYVARYYVVALVCSAIPLAYVVAMALLPESPAFLAVKGALLFVKGLESKVSRVSRLLLHSG